MNSIVHYYQQVHRCCRKDGILIQFLLILEGNHKSDRYKLNLLDTWHIDHWLRMIQLLMRIECIHSVSIWRYLIKPTCCACSICIHAWSSRTNLTNSIDPAQSCNTITCSTDNIVYFIICAVFGAYTILVKWVSLRTFAFFCVKVVKRIYCTSYTIVVLDPERSWANSTRTSDYSISTQTDALGWRAVIDWVLSTYKNTFLWGWIVYCTLRAFSAIASVFCKSRVTDTGTCWVATAWWWARWTS